MTTRTDRRQFLTSLGGAVALGAATQDPTLGSRVAAAETPRRRPLKIFCFGFRLPFVFNELQRALNFQVMYSSHQRNANPDASQMVGFEQLAEADLWIGSANKHVPLTEAELRLLRDFVAAGKPFVGTRAGHHAYLYTDAWRIDRDVFGVTYGSHHAMHLDPVMQVELTESGRNSPLLRDIDPPAPRSGSYYHRNLAPEVDVLMHAGVPRDMQPHTWTRIIPQTNNRVFYTRYDYGQIEREADVRRIFLRGLLWTINRL